MIASEPMAPWTYCSSDIRSAFRYSFLLVTYVWQTCVLTCYMTLWSTSTHDDRYPENTRGLPPTDVQQTAPPSRRFDTFPALGCMRMLPESDAGRTAPRI
jgi:hypothetical protein